ncbi:MAG: helix-turn-helix domain-containing protein [Acidobacteria bacterium]|nr:helix-turn-helix domain-containing protein [Acidobacteriota bacterium]MCA1652067.1 helix-turn-helix domain-containing protein [Acidobacteriota bacterium]
MAHSIIAELRRQREARGLDLLALSRRTGVRVTFLECIDRGDVGTLPAGLYGRAAIRGYAVGVGIDPDAALSALAPHLRTLEDPIDGLARVRGISRPAPSRSSPTVQAEEPGHVREAHVSPPWPPLAASLCDGLLLAVIDLMLLALTAIACGTTMEITLLRAGPALILLWALIGCAYYLLLGGIRGGTVGQRLWEVPRTDGAVPVTLNAAWRRGAQWAAFDCLAAGRWIVTATRIHVASRTGTQPASPSRDRSPDTSEHRWPPVRGNAPA